MVGTGMLTTFVQGGDPFISNGDSAFNGSGTSLISPIAQSDGSKMGGSTTIPIITGAGTVGQWADIAFVDGTSIVFHQARTHRKDSAIGAKYDKYKMSDLMGLSMG